MSSGTDKTKKRNNDSSHIKSEEQVINKVIESELKTNNDSTDSNQAETEKGNKKKSLFQSNIYKGNDSNNFIKVGSFNMDKSLLNNDSLKLLKEQEKLQNMNHKDILLYWATDTSKKQLLLLNIIIISLLLILVGFMIKNANIKEWLVFMDAILFFIQFYITATFLELLGIIGIIVHYVFGDKKLKDIKNLKNKNDSE